MSPKRADKIATGVIYGIVGIICAILLFIIAHVLIKGLPSISLGFLTKPAESFQAGGGIGPQIFNSLYLLVITLVISIPISLGSAIYLTEYAPKNKLTSAVKTSVEVLSSLPSIVVGLFGFLLFVIYFGWSFSILSGALTLTIFNLPTLVRVMQQSLASVPDSQREGTLALGLTRWECSKYILIPSALPGIITGVILCAGRIFGEAAALIYTAGQSAPALDFTSLDITSPSNPWNLMRPAETLAVHIWKVNSEGITPDAVDISNGSAAVLIIAILIFNILARYLGKVLYKKMTGGASK
ncbi:phosphate ABC transporter permease PstA [Peptostreptococcus faecalis]|uniref:phosphate ABC transporter permease PstA n=1 Tax=Peptostreptococcus faecalis TaxID=2045015 RepID=UPI000C7DAA01|nr:phosphate ABC transporter permease PstA [Peptostreptococcus faecalis]